MKLSLKKSVEKLRSADAVHTGSMAVCSGVQQLVEIRI